MRTTVDENMAFGEFIAGKLNACDGPVRFLLPEGGVSLLDAPGQPFWDPDADAALFTTIEEQVVTTPTRRVERVSANINDAGVRGGGTGRVRGGHRAHDERAHPQRSCSPGSTT